MRPAYRIGYRGLTGRLKLGRSLDQWEDVQLGATRVGTALRVALPVPPLQRRTAREVNGLFTHLRRDALNAVDFPTGEELLSVKLKRLRIRTDLTDSSHK